MELKDLSDDQLVQLLAAVEHSRKSAKRVLHHLGLPATSEDVDAAVHHARARPNFAMIQKRVANFTYYVDRDGKTATQFDPLGDLQRELKRRAETPDAFAARIELESGIPAPLVTDILTGKADAPMSAFFTILVAAGAQHVHFDPTKRSILK